MFYAFELVSHISHFGSNSPKKTQESKPSAPSQLIFGAFISTEAALGSGKQSGWSVVRSTLMMPQLEVVKKHS